MLRIGGTFRRAAGKDDGARVQSARRRLGAEPLFRKFDAEDLRVQNFCAEVFCLFQPCGIQVFCGDPVCKPVIVLDKFRFRECAAVLCDDGDGRAAAHGVQRSRNAGGTSANDEQVFHYYTAP